MERVTYMTPRGKVWMNGTMKSQQRVAERMRRSFLCECKVFLPALHNQNCEHYIAERTYSV